MSLLAIAIAKQGLRSMCCVVKLHFTTIPRPQNMELDLGSADPAHEQEQAMETGPENGLGETEAPAAAQSAPLDLGKRPERDYQCSRERPANGVQSDKDD